MAKIYGKSKIGKNVYLGDNVIIGHPGKDEKALLEKRQFGRLAGAIIGSNCVIRDYTIIYSNVVLDQEVNTGHFVLIREHTTVGRGTLIGTGTIIDGHCEIGRNVSIQTGVYIPTGTIINDNVFIGPRVCFTNDKYMDVKIRDLKGCRVLQGARIGANSTILPGIIIGKNAVVGSGAVVTKNVKDGVIVAGVPAREIRTRKSLSSKKLLRE